MDVHSAKQHLQDRTKAANDELGWISGQKYADSAVYDDSVSAHDDFFFKRQLQEFETREFEFNKQIELNNATMEALGKINSVPPQAPLQQSSHTVSTSWPKMIFYHNKNVPVHNDAEYKELLAKIEAEACSGNIK